MLSAVFVSVFIHVYILLRVEWKGLLVLASFKLVKTLTLHQHQLVWPWPSYQRQSLGGEGQETDEMVLFPHHSYTLKPVTLAPQRATSVDLITFSSYKNNVLSECRLGGMLTPGEGSSSWGTVLAKTTLVSRVILMRNSPDRAPSGERSSSGTILTKASLMRKVILMKATLMRSHPHEGQPWQRLPTCERLSWQRPPSCEKSSSWGTILTKATLIRQDLKATSLMFSSQSTGMVIHVGEGG